MLFPVFSLAFSVFFGKKIRVKRAIFPVFLAAALCGCTTSSRIVTGQTRPPISADAVRVYSAMPPGSEPIATVSATADTALTWQRLSDRAVARLKAEAAKLGANGLVITGTANDLWGGASTVTGTAFWIDSR